MQCLPLWAHAPIEWGFQDAEERLVSGLGEIIQPKLDGARVVAKAEGAEDSIPHR